MSEAEVLQRLKDWYTSHHQELAAAGLTTTLSESPPGRPKAAVWVDVDSDHRLSSLIVWDTGEAELNLGDVQTGQVLPQHHEVRSPSDLDDVLAQMLSWAGGA